MVPLSDPPAGSFTRRPWSSSVYLRCQKSSRACTCGISAKLYSGTGVGIDHSSVRPSHGSAGALRGLRAVMITLTRKISTEKAMTNEPAETTMFIVSQPMPSA